MEARSRHSLSLSKPDAHLPRKPAQVLFWLCSTFLCQTYSLPFSRSRTSLLYCTYKSHPQCHQHHRPPRL